MKQLLGFLIGCFVLLSCGNQAKKVSQASNSEIKTEVITTDDYELIKSSSKSKAVLILFGGYPESAVNIKREFNIVDIAKRNQIDLLLMNFNRKLWLEENEKITLAELLQKAFTDHNLLRDNVYIGGFSSGGNISLLISDFMLSKLKYFINPKGVFIIDSPVDLLGLYNCSKKNIERNFSASSVQESKNSIQRLEDAFGDPAKDISKFEKASVYTMETNNFENVQYLKFCKIRLYTEPDTNWWMENRKNTYEEMNAYGIKQLAETLQKKFGPNNKVEYISTQNRGYRSNGARHPHSWSIVDEQDLIHWMLK